MLDFAKKTAASVSGSPAAAEGISKVEDIIAQTTGDLNTKVGLVSKFLETIQGQKEQIVKVVGEEKREVLDKVDGMLDTTNQYKKKIEDAKGDEGTLNKIKEEWTADANKMYQEGLAEVVKVGEQFKEKAAEGVKGVGKKFGGLF